MAHMVTEPCLQTADHPPRSWAWLAEMPIPVLLECGLMKSLTRADFNLRVRIIALAARYLGLYMSAERASGKSWVHTSLPWHPGTVLRE